MGVYQARLLTHDTDLGEIPYCERLAALLSQDLDFHSQGSRYASHNFHSFPAKFPPQLPRKFIEALTTPGDIVLDPMMGSGTTVLEAFLAGRRGIGFDIDPLALMLTKAKVTPLDARQVSQTGKEILQRASLAVKERRKELEEMLEKRWDSKTRDFIDYWFAHETQIDLLALITEIQRIDNTEVRTFFELAFSAIIITKSGGVSLAFDLAHTRPHRAKVVIDRTGKVIVGNDLIDRSSHRIKLLTKKLRPPLKEFEKRVRQNLSGLLESDSDRIQPYLDGLLEPDPERIEPCIMLGDAQGLPLDNESIDLIVTSPPYASNAIDYMRAHKFSLVWMDYAIGDLGQRRKEYIGGEAVTGFAFEVLPSRTEGIVASVSGQDKKRGGVLRRYYSEVTRALREMFRVLKPGKAAIVVVGSSMMRGRDTEIHTCLVEIGQGIGFQVPRIGVRSLDRNRRMMPAGLEFDPQSQIQQRMYKEYVIGFYKPEA